MKVPNIFVEFFKKKETKKFKYIWSFAINLLILQPEIYK